MCEKFCGIWANIAAQIASEAKDSGPLTCRHCRVNQIPHEIYIIKSPNGVPGAAQRLVHKLVTIGTTGCPRMFSHYTVFHKNIKNIKSTMSLTIILVIECLICTLPTVKISFTYLYPLPCDMVSLKIDE